MALDTTVMQWTRTINLCPYIFFFLQVLYLVSLWSFSLVYYLKSIHSSCTYLSNWTCMLLEELVMRVVCVINYGVVKLYSIVSFLSVSLLSDLYTVNQVLWSGGWDYSLKFYTWRLCPGSNPLLVFIQYRKATPSCMPVIPTLEHYIPFLNPCNEVRNNIMEEDQALPEEILVTYNEAFFVQLMLWQKSRFTYPFIPQLVKSLLFNSPVPLLFETSPNRPL